MRIRTDDEVYRVDAVWLGPPKATFPWRARYVAWGVGIPVFLVVLTVERQLGIGFGFFSTAWAFIATIVITRLITSRISHERPLGAVLAMWARELTTPRERKSGTGGAAGAGKIRVRTERPRPRQRHGIGRPARHVLPQAVAAHQTAAHQTAAHQTAAQQTTRNATRARRRRKPAAVGR